MRVEDFIEAVVAGDVTTVRSALADRPELLVATGSYDGHGGWSALHVAVRQGRAEVIAALLEAGADVDAIDTEGRTPLHVALEHDNRMRDMLLDAGATIDVNAAAFLDDAARLRELLATDPSLANDMTTLLSPLGWASYGNAVGAATLLVEAGARVDRGELGCAAAVNAVRVGHVLLGAGAEPDLSSPPSGAAPLHVAAAMRFSSDTTEFARLLLDVGADVNVRTADGRTPLDIAEAGVQRQRSLPEGYRSAYRPMAELLRSRGGTRGAVPDR